MIVLIDVGNTRIKWALYNDGQIHNLEAIDAACKEPPAPWAAIEQPERVWVSSVGSDLVNEKIEQWVIDAFGLRPEFARVRTESVGMRTLYDKPEQLGVDRWLGALAGYHLAQGAVGVVDAGTALTIDIVDVAGNHLGGSISPGLTLMRKSLSKNTARLHLDTIEVTHSVATNTAEAISTGCLDAVAGGIERMNRRLLEEGMTHSWYLTGGEAPLLLDACHLHFQHVPDLVLRGLALAMREN